MTRRNQAAVAVSKTADPTDGFYTYWWHETVDNGQCNTAAGCGDPDFKKSGEGSDYPTLGISPKYFVAAVGVNRRDPVFKVQGDTTGTATYEAWKACLTKFTTADGKDFDWCGPFYAHVMVVDADALAKGNTFNPGDTFIGGFGGKPPPFLGRSFALFGRADNYLTDRTADGDFACAGALSVRPVVMHSPPLAPATPFAPTLEKAEAFLANVFIDRVKGKPPQTSIILWSLVGDELIPTQYLLKLRAELTPLGTGMSKPQNRWRSLPLNASYRDGYLHIAFPEIPTHDNPDADGCVRLIRINTLNPSEGKRERRFGGPNKFDDPASARFHLTYPAVEVNAAGDVVVVYTRFSQNSALAAQEIRYSVWYHNEPDIRPSRRLHVAETVGTHGTDTAGIAVDPSDDKTIWMAHTYRAKKVSGDAYDRMAVGAVKP